MQGVRIFFTSWKSRFFPKKYKGSAEEICRQIVEECWNGRYFQTSTGNFAQFWARDFGWCTASLLKLGYNEKVKQTLRYAVNRYKKANKITTTLTPKGKAFDFPTYAVDSIPWLIHSMRLSKFNYYDHKEFLNKEIRKFYEKVVDPSTGLVKKGHFSSMKDHTVRNSSCYDNSMVAMLANDLKNMKLFNPFKGDNSKLLEDKFWNGKYFEDDLDKGDYIAGDANIFPFLCGGIKDEEKLRSCIKYIQAAFLDDPFPLKYTQNREGINFISEEIFARDYESNAIWMHMGPLYVKLVKEVDLGLYEKYEKQYTNLIEHHQNYLEVFNKEGKPYSSPFYYCDSGMLWACNYLTL
tara:strand:+ start:3006 stop:4058 length:1053 start_codon:yes stop_codon:yes gene_type:complete